MDPQTYPSCPAGEAEEEGPRLWPQEGEGEEEDPSLRVAAELLLDQGVEVELLLDQGVAAAHHLHQGVEVELLLNQGVAAAHHWHQGVAVELLLGPGAEVAASLGARAVVPRGVPPPEVRQGSVRRGISPREPALGSGAGSRASSPQVDSSTSRAARE